MEETFVSKNPKSTLKLGQARGALLLAPAIAGIPVFEYTPNLIKKSLVGTGHAQKEQVAMMVGTLLPAAGTVRVMLQMPWLSRYVTLTCVAISK